METQNNTEYLKAIPTWKERLTKRNREIFESMAPHPQSILKGIILAAIKKSDILDPNSFFDEYTPSNI